MAEELKTKEEMLEEIDSQKILTGDEEDIGKKVDVDYNASDIKILHGLEAVRIRPGMYIGTTGPQGLHHIIWEIVDNAVDEALAGRCDTIDVVLEEGNICSVSDNGSGIPVDIHPETGRPAIESVFTTLHAGGKFNEGGAYRVSGGLHGVGASVTNALSEWLEVYVRRNGNIYYQPYHVDEKTDLKVIGTYPDGERTGTRVRFLPDKTIFQEGVEFNYEVVRAHLQQLAFLNKGVKFTIEDQRSGHEQPKVEYKYEGGLNILSTLKVNKQKFSLKLLFSTTTDLIHHYIAIQTTLITLKVEHMRKHSNPLLQDY